MCWNYSRPSLSGSVLGTPVDCDWIQVYGILIPSVPWLDVQGWAGPGSGTLVTSSTEQFRGFPVVCPATSSFCACAMSGWGSCPEPLVQRSQGRQKLCSSGVGEQDSEAVPKIPAPGVRAQGHPLPLSVNVDSEYDGTVTLMTR